MSDASSPALLRIELGMGLRRLRESVGKTIDQVSQELTELYGPGFSTTKLSRIETGKRPAGQRDVRDLCLYYEVSRAELDRFVELAKASRAENRWQGSSDAYAAYVVLESLAHTVRTYEPMLIPGLLQTPGYSRAIAVGNDLDLTGRPDGGDPNLDAKIAVRTERQRRLAEPNPVLLRAVLDEGVLRRRIGPPGVMAQQLRHLHEVSRLPNVSLQIVPFSQGAYIGMEWSGFTILEFSPGAYSQERVCYVEGNLGVIWAEREADRRHMDRLFGHLERIALGAAQTRTLLKDMEREST
jgi:hypothetical protein